MSEAACILLCAAEPSGDSLGAALIGALRQRLGARVRFFGVGGPLMAAEGLVSAFDVGPLSVLGVTDALRAYPLVLRRAREVGELAAREKPHLAVLIDSWGFNLRVARAIRRVAPATQLIKYVAPQVWATRPGRARTLAGAVDFLLSIHAFDADLFERAGLSTTFVGNPVLTAIHPPADPQRLRARLGIAADAPLLVIAPGSRDGEIARLMRPFGEAAMILSKARPSLHTVVLAADAVAGTVIDRVRLWPVQPLVVSTETERRDAMAAATVALACSGTVTTELALAGAPMIVAYRLDPLTYQIARRLLRTPYITLLNVAAGRPIVQELIQESCTGQRLASAVGPLLDDPDLRARQTRSQAEALEIMRGGIDDAAGAAADAVIARLRL